jgi:peptide/nickel transport system permease protein
MTAVVMQAAAPRGGRAQGLRSTMGQLLRRPEGLIGVVILLIFTVLAIAPVLLVGPLQTAVTATGSRLEAPSAAHIFGTDELGRDMLNLTVHGARISLTIGLLATFVTVAVGVVVGIVAGFVGGFADSGLMRITDFFLVIPTFVLALILTPIIQDVVGSAATEVLGIRMSLVVIIFVIGITSWSSTARIIRSQTLSLRERAFVDRARVVGSSNGHIMRRHILPNVINLIVANAVLTFAGAVLLETTLSFVGLGDPFQPSWGQTLEAARAVGAPGLGDWWYFGPPGICIILVVLAFTLVGNALDDILNPKRRERR